MSERGRKQLAPPCPYCGSPIARPLPTCGEHADLIALDPEWWLPDAIEERSTRRRMFGWWLKPYSLTELVELAAGLHDLERAA